MTEKQLESLLTPVYGEKDAHWLAEEIIELSHSYHKVESTSDNPYWYKYLNLYTIYPDALHSRSVSPLTRLNEHIEWISDLGCNCLHILPFLESPMIDKGFDVSNFYKVRKGLGSILDLRDILSSADELGMRVFMDLVSNHVSDQHEWFLKAQQGDQFYRDFFLYSEDKPILVQKYHKGTEVRAKYLVGEEEKELFIVFPEQVGEIPHWRQGTDGYWYYHTFYPQQLDLNWLNPHVFLEFSKILMHWASFGFHFRLDAIRHIGLPAYKDAEGENTAAHHIVTALANISELINPECTFIVESYEKMKEIIKYFGSSNKSEAHIAYNFHLSTHIWISLLKRDASYVWRKINEGMMVPKHAEWVNFLRNHDELSLDHISTELSEEMKEKLIPNGVPFREGHGVSGRTFSFLGNSEKRFLMAYFLLASLPGGLGVIYGDEVGKANVPMKKLSKQEQLDSRNVNRGRLSRKLMESGKAKRVYKTMCSIMTERNLLREYMNVMPTELEMKNPDPKVFTAVYTLGISKLYVFVNLSGKPKEVPVRIYGGRTVLKINECKAYKSKVKLGRYGCMWIQV
jgi:maltose alpha-D-glucosyltransferase/alpha-amylase